MTVFSTYILEATGNNLAEPQRSPDDHRGDYGLYSYGYDPQEVPLGTNSLISEWLNSNN